MRKIFINAIWYILIFCKTFINRFSKATRTCYTELNIVIVPDLFLATRRRATMVAWACPSTSVVKLPHHEIEFYFEKFGLIKSSLYFVSISFFFFLRIALNVVLIRIIWFCELVSCLFCTNFLKFHTDNRLELKNKKKKKLSFY